jgi:hypothetical protein
MSDGSGEWVDGVSMSNDSGASLPMGLWYPNKVPISHGACEWMEQ